ncbi:hypothetical protein QWZ03_16770 [Chitinimonas viridis]|uniref:J domain-containing protein n=1 Tax=Chitinimonas viridis TaxID=664880 RepID=A0ABT8B9C3_9NEIS|nr:hypothetical protein [Chitinimonas viridis]MDN3578425.1 hypothetical protein [Chitinimonas viridis]
MSHTQGKTYYSLLGVGPQASQAELDAAFIAMQKVLAEVVDSRVRESRLQKLEEVYQLLSNPLRRSVYDASLQAGQAQRVVLQSEPAPSVRTSHSLGSNPLIKVGVGLLGLLVVGYLYFAWRQQATLDAYQTNVKAMQERALSMQQEAIRRANEQEAAVMASERYAEDGMETAEQRAARLAIEARDREYADWNRKVSREYERAQDEKERNEARKRSEREREERERDRQRERDEADAIARLERERQAMFNRLLSERRYYQARELAKTQSEFDRIKYAEKYGR